MNYLNNLRLIVKEAKKYLLFLSETGREEQGKKIIQAIREVNYADVEKSLVDCICAEDNEQRQDRRRWLLEYTMRGKPQDSPEAARAKENNEQENSSNSSSGQKY